MKVHQAYVLLGNNNTGKTTFQKNLIEFLTGQKYERLDCNKTFEFRNANGEVKGIFVMSRSFQEKTDLYVDIENYFNRFFIEKEYAILSSHLETIDICELIKQLKKKWYNVNAVFFLNSLENDRMDNKNISLLDWDSRIVVQNHTDLSIWQDLISHEAKAFSNMLLKQ